MCVLPGEQLQVLDEDDEEVDGEGEDGHGRFFVV
jgi:hypothetical protein